MTVKELREKLKDAPDDSVVGLCYFGNHVVRSIEVGKLPSHTTGYVLLFTAQR